MTKPLTKAEKRKNREERRKAAAAQVIPAEQGALVNKCDTCAYEFGACDGVPKFASEGDDRVVECATWVDVATLPTADQRAAEPPEEKTNAGPVQVAAEEKKKPEEALTAAQEEGKKKLQRFQRKEDLGACPACQTSLKRTAFNRDRDAVRCTNPRCRQYRAVVRNIPAE